jgi:hypothetical protein
MAIDYRLEVSLVPMGQFPPIEDHRRLAERISDRVAERHGDGGR